MTGFVTNEMVERAMNDPANCSQCYGCGKVADTKEGESWLVWLVLPPGSDIAVVMELPKPIPCPRCEGTGKPG